MADARWRRLLTLVCAALERPTGERERFLAEACPDDADLRAEARGLVAGAAHARGFLETPAVAGWAAGEAGATEPVLTGTRFGPYLLTRRLGSGGMGAVFLASRSDGAYRGDVAIKLLHPAVEGSQAWRLRSERQILSGLQHPGIARLLDGGTADDGTPYLVMELVEGEPIDRYCDRHGLGVRGRLELFLKVCDAVRYAHRKLVVHRDLKPSNILVTRDGEPKLLDFGIAKLLDPDLEAGPGETTRTGMRPLTPDYASPEQLRGEPIGIASDVYSLGVLLFDLLTGALPRQFTDLSPAAIERVLVRRPARLSEAVQGAAGEGGSPEASGPMAAAVRPMSPRQLARQLAGDLDTIADAALRDEPERRYESVDELAGDIRRHLDGLPVRARPQTLGYRAGKFVRRNAVTVTVAGVALACVAGFVITVGLQARRIARERDTAQQVTRFMVELFESAHPESARGEEVTVRAVLDRGAARIDDDLRGQPEVQATLDVALGSVYAALGRYDESDRRLGHALALLEAERGPDDVSLIPVLGGLAENDVIGRRRHEAAERLLERALRIGEGELDDDDDEMIDTLYLLGLAETGAGDYESAEAHFRRVIESATRAHGSTDEKVSKGLSGLAMMYEERGEYAAAVAMLEQVLANVDVPDPPSTDDLATVLSSLGRLRWSMGDLDAAAPLLERSLAIREEVYGPDHPDLTVTVNNLALVLHDLGQLDEAEALYRRALAVKAEAFGVRSPQYLATLNNLADLHFQRGDLAAARREWQQVVETCEAVLGAGNRRTLSTRVQLARVDVAVGRLAAAEAEVSVVLQQLTETLGEAHPDVAMVRASRAALLLELGRPQEAEPVARQALEVLTVSPGQEHPRYRELLMVAAGIDAALGRVEQAEGRLERVFELATAATSTPTATADRATARLALGRLLLSRGEAERARAAWLEALRLVEGVSPDAVDVRLVELRAELLVALGRTDEARPLVERLWRLGLRRPEVVRLADRVGIAERHDARRST